MFRIEKICLNTQKGVFPIKFGQFTYVYGGHDKGKTMLLDIIDYMCGDSTFKFKEKHAMKNIDSIEMTICNNNRMLCLKRDDESFFYKHSELDAEFIRVVTVQEYKEIVQRFVLENNYEEVDDFKTLTDKNIGYRSLSLFNYLQESGVGDISNVFPKSKEYGEMMSLKWVMLYLFNKTNVKRICKLKQENEDLEKKIKELREQSAASEYYEKIIRDNMAKLSIDNTRSILELKEMFAKFKQERSQLKNNVDGDYLYLVKASKMLDEEIKYQSCLERQVGYQLDSLKGANKLLKLLKDIMIKSDKYQGVAFELSEKIKANVADIAFLDCKDYKRSISNLREQKLALDKRIAEINVGLTPLDFEHKMRIISILDDAFSNYSPNGEVQSLHNLEDKLKNNNKQIEKLYDYTNKESIESFNGLLTSIYEQFSNLELVKRDFEFKSFRLLFNPLKVCVSAERCDDGQTISYAPGSKARMVLWQLSVYLTMSKYIMSNYNHMPFLPYLAIDAVIQEFSDEQQPIDRIINILRNFAQENNIQIVICGPKSAEDTKLNQDEIIDISSGLNPAFER